MFFWRALLGVGEASYGVIAPTLLSDLFPRGRRGRAMGLYYLALPLGGALGYGSGVGSARSGAGRRRFWSSVCPACSPPLAGARDRGPGRGASEGLHAGKARPARGSDDYLALFQIPTFVFNTAGMAAVTFATGAYAVHGANFYQIVRGMSMKEAGTVDRRPDRDRRTCSASRWAHSWPTYCCKFTRRAYLLLAGVVVARRFPWGSSPSLTRSGASLGCSSAPWSCCPWCLARATR